MHLRRSDILGPLVLVVILVAFLAAIVAMGGIDIALIAHGSLPDQKACEASVAMTLKEIDTNALSVIALATRLAELFEGQGSGMLAVIGSVAGDRGRQRGQRPQPKTAIGR